MKKIISIEGTNGVGKTTVSKLFSTKGGYHFVRVPGYEHNQACVDIREILDKNPSMNKIARLLLYAADMSICLDATGEYDKVVFDRSWLSTIVYQHYIEDINFDIVMRVISTSLTYTATTINKFVFLTCDPLVLMDRLKKRSKKTISAYDNKGIDYYAKIQDMYRVILDQYSDHIDYIEIDTTSKTPSMVYEEAKEFIG